MSNISIKQIENFEITLTDINQLIKSRCDVDLMNTRLTRATYHIAMLRRCFVNLAYRYTTSKGLAISKALHLSVDTINFYKYSFELLRYNEYYNGIFLNISTEIRKLKKDVDPITKIYEEMKLLEHNFNNEMNKLKKELAKLYETIKT